ncbi:hypothetical protein Dda_8677 [Drechslerella dactyloides]|uniref:Uncharacterized protein n=1 Tax=Drechslerella dactyloides TaxID=74499 RepID=A0AAD6NG16_DREDA|nr:hypothetical protein Dda_8677 [Drechslerella dactyloides]
MELNNIPEGDAWRHDGLGESSEVVDLAELRIAAQRDTSGGSDKPPSPGHTSPKMSATAVATPSGSNATENCDGSFASMSAECLRKRGIPVLACFGVGEVEVGGPSPARQATDNDAYIVVNDDIDGDANSELNDDDDDDDDVWSTMSSPTLMAEYLAVMGDEINPRSSPTNPAIDEERPPAYTEIDADRPPAYTRNV